MNKQKGDLRGVRAENLRFETLSNAHIDITIEVNKHHPALCLILRDTGSTEWEDQLAEIAAFVGVVMDGNYYPYELEPIYTDILLRLRQRRGAA